MGAKNYLLLATLLTVSALTAACHKSLPESRYAVDNPRFEILIVGDTSEFKDGIREQLIQTYGRDSNIALMGMSRLEEIDPEDYDVILIMDTCLAWTHFNPSLMSFLDHHPNLDHLVLFITAGDPDWQFSHQGLDAVTSASRIDEESRVVGQLRRQIDGILIKSGKTP
jgi:hypothetical protein